MQQTMPTATRIGLLWAPFRVQTARVQFFNIADWLQDDLSVQKQWFINGRHYSLTLEAWLAKQDAQRKEIMPIMSVRPLASPSLQSRA